MEDHQNMLHTLAACYFVNNFQMFPCIVQTAPECAIRILYTPTQQQPAFENGGVSVMEHQASRTHAFREVKVILLARAK